MKTHMKNIAIDILEYEEWKKNSKEWFNKECRQWNKRISHTKAYLARPVRAKRVEHGEKRR
jgi:hypothetical protein